MNSKILTALLLFASTSAWAQSHHRISEPFDAPLNRLPEGWEAKLRGDGEAFIAEVADSPGKHGLLLRRSEEKPGNAAVYLMGEAGRTLPENIKDFSGSVNLRYLQPLKAVLSTRGVIIRAQKPAYDNFSGYYLCIAPRGDQRSLALYFNPNSHLEPGELVAETPIPTNLTALRDYQLKFEVRGKVIRGELWNVDGTGNPSELIAELETREAADTPGYFGLRGAYGNKKASTWFYSLHLEFQ